MKVSAFLAFVFCLPLFLAGRAAARPADGGYQMKRIVLDAGHGGKDPGTQAAGRLEKDIVLDIALRVGKLIGQNLSDVEVIYTRKSDVFVELDERAGIANRAGADLFVSIHADASEISTPKGSSSWVMGLSAEKENLELAMRENSVITYEEDYRTVYQDFDPTDPASYILFALRQSIHQEQSIALAALFQKHYGKQTSIVTSRGVRQQIFVVLRKTTMPSVLTEIGFLTNAADRAYITSEKGKNQIARSIFDAIAEYKDTVEGNAHVIASGPAEESSSAAEPVAVQPVDGEAAAGQPGLDAPVFRVQVSASRTRVARNRFGEYAGRVEERRIGEYYKYFVGETSSYSEAIALQRRARATFRDAFIVPFRGGEPVVLTDDMKRD